MPNLILNDGFHIGGSDFDSFPVSWAFGVIGFILVLFIALLPIRSRQVLHNLRRQCYIFESAEPRQIVDVDRLSGRLLLLLLLFGQPILGSFASLLYGSYSLIINVN